MSVRIETTTRDLDADTAGTESLAEDFASERRNNAISKALGEELRRAREERGWSRVELVTRLPSGIGERTLLSYEPAPRGALFYPL